MRKPSRLTSAEKKKCAQKRLKLPPYAHTKDSPREIYRGTFSEILVRNRLLAPLEEFQKKSFSSVGLGKQ